MTTTLQSSTIPSSRTARKTGKKPLRAAIVGAGKISEEHLRFLFSSPLSQVCGVCDLSPSMARFSANLLGNAPAFSDLDQMLAEANPEVVHVLTPPHTHSRLVTQSLRAGAHVIVEKPVATSVEEYLLLKSIADEEGRFLVEDQNYRFNRPILQLKKLLDAGRIGQLREVEVRMNLGIRNAGGRYADRDLPHPSHKLPAGVLHEFLTHLCYLTLDFAPEIASPDRVASAWSNHGGGELFQYDDLDSMIVAGRTHARIRFSAQTAPDCFMVTIRGSRGWAEVDIFQPYLKLVAPRGLGAIDPLGNHLANGLEFIKSSVAGFHNKLTQRTPYEGLQRFLGQTYLALSGQGALPVTPTEMEQAARLIEVLLDEANRV